MGSVPPAQAACASSFFLLLLLVTVLVFFSSVWLAMFLAKQITRPVAALADAMDEIAAGKYQQRVGLAVTGEMAELVRSFNHMAADLETSRQLAESSSAQLTAANQALEERRRVAGDHRGDDSQRLGHAGCLGSGGAGQSRVCRADGAARGRRSARHADRIAAVRRVRLTMLGAVIRRGHRMGAASTEIEMHAGGRDHAPGRDQRAA